MLKLIFEWLDTHVWIYWVIAAVPTLVLLVWLTRLIWGDPPPNRFSLQKVIFPLLVLAVLFAWRWPFLLSADEYNPDESQLIAGAMTLRFDAIPWRGVDGFTSGPLNFYPLLVPRLLGLPLDYFTARFVGLLLIGGALLACSRLFSSRFGSPLGELGILPALAFFCTVTDADFIHYSSEHLSLFLTALSAWCLLRRSTGGTTTHRWVLGGCFTAGLLPWAKLQSAPLAATLVFAALIAAGRDKTPAREKGRSIFYLLAAAAAPTACMLLVVVTTGQFEHFFRSYILQNFTYVSDGASIRGTVRDLWDTSRMTMHFPVYLITSLFGVAAALLTGSRRDSSTQREPSWRIALILLVVSAACILTPRRALLHYVLLSVIPLALLLGLSLGRSGNAVNRRTRVWLGSGMLLFGFLIPFGVRAAQPVPIMFGGFLAHWREPRTVLADIVRLYAGPTSRMAIWGWLPSLYVETGVPQGTRDGNTSWAMMPSPHRQYYLQRFLADLERNAPDLFVDAVGFGSRFYPDRAQAGHESFPALQSYIIDHYQLAADGGYARIYAKKGLSSRSSSPRSKHFLLTPNGSIANDSLRRESITPADLPQRKTRTGWVQMMNPPAEIVWALEDNIREVTFEYGFAPEAYRAANRTDGVELIFELRSEGVPVRPLFNRMLDPQHRPADRGPVTGNLILPPFKSGARLVARTTVGMSGNNAWDWFYLGSVMPLTSVNYAPTQFPHFNRVPNTVDADLSYRLQEGDDSLLILHAPALLTYHLAGDERRVRFDYGFRAGAYSDGGQTDGAIFKVELHRANAPVQVLF
ncbi:MAG: hypothetical protein ABIZ81_18685, partial [Opitutaceae bacterium]